MASINSINKRRRTASDALHISDLPIGFIADVSAYLSMLSRTAFVFVSSCKILFCLCGRGAFMCRIELGQRGRHFVHMICTDFV